MNKKIKIALIIVFVFLVIMAVREFLTADGLDEITNYTITVNPRNDGTLDMKYHIEWKVLDSTSEGPLEWVKIGIPNMRVDNIKKLTDNIENIQYYPVDGDYVRIDFKKKYYAGETVTFEFSIHQSHMYKVNTKNRKITYQFTPGWFNDIQVKEAVIKWKADKVSKHNGEFENGYIVWNKSLLRGQKINAKIEYPVGTFKIDYTKQQIKTNSPTIGPKMIAILFIILYIIIIIIRIISPIYYWHGGYGYYPYYHHHHYHRHHHHRGGFGGFGGGRRQFVCLCLCLCRWRKSWMCQKRFLWN